MSCHVIVHSCLSLSMGSWGVAAGANLVCCENLVSGRGQGTPWTSHQLIAGPSLMSNVGFSISLKDTLTCSSTLPRAGIRTSDLPITGRPSLAAELLSAAIIYHIFSTWHQTIKIRKPLPLRTSTHCLCIVP